jgi:predicted nucleic acid-binding protein
MKKALFDTSVYGRIIEKEEVDLIKNLVEGKIIIYGNRVIRKELRDTPKKIKAIEGEKLRNLRIYLLTLYDELVKNHDFEITNEILKLAEDYYFTYKEIGGKRGKDSLFNDFIIIACASLKRMDIVVSEDMKTMLGNDEIKTYRLVNKIKNIKNPNFINYEKFKEILRSGKFNKFTNNTFKFRILNVLPILFPYFFVGFFRFHKYNKNPKYIKFLVGK